MKTSLQLLAAILIITVANLLNISSSFGQSPEKMSYQAVIRDANGQLLASQSISIQISILQGSETGSSVYTETHTLSTNNNGLVTFEIGTGISSDDFAFIDWANGPYFIKTETDPNGGSNYTIIGTSQLLSAPYALYAKTVESESDPLFTASPISSVSQSDIDNWRNKLDEFTEVDPVFMASPFGNLSQTDIDEWNNKLNEFIEADPLFAASLANGITATDTAYWNSKLDEFIETDPTFLAHPSAGITEEDITKWSALWIWYTTNEKGYISTETDPLFETSIAKGITTVDTAAWNNDIGATEIDDLSDAKTDVGSIFLGSGAGANDDGTNNQNVAVGIDALKANTSGNSNTANGFRALYYNTTGSYNTANGRMTLYSNTDGYNNTANGYEALMFNTIGNFNTANGQSALYHNTTGFSNTANGSASLYKNKTGSYNTASGYKSLIYNVSGSNNTAIGYEAGNLNTSGSGNIFLGKQAGYNETGSNKLYIENSDASTPLIFGDFDADLLRINGSFTTASAGSEVTGSFLSTSTSSQSAVLNVIVGGSANPTNIVHIIDSSGDDPNLLKVDGPSANEFIITNAGKVGIGTNSPDEKLHIAGSLKMVDGNEGDGKVLSSDANGVASWVTISNDEISGLGTMSTQDSTAVNIDGGNIDGTAIGLNSVSTGKFSTLETTKNLSLPSTTDTSGVIYFGNISYMHNFGGDNLFIGYRPGNYTTTGQRNIGIGRETMKNISTGTSNVSLGESALSELTTGNQNVAIGAETLQKVTSAWGNVAVGRGALLNNTAGNNTAIGYQAMWYNSSGIWNVSVGSEALFTNTSGRGNTAFGYNGLYKNLDGDYNLALGTYALYDNESGSGNIAIGYSAGYGEVGSNKLYIENSNSTSPLIYGDFDADSLKINGDLKVSGTVKIEGGTPGTGKVLTSDASGNATWENKGITTYSIGDFVQGGIVFWVDETEQHGLVCSKTEISAAIRWYAGSFGNTRAYGAGEFAGEMNTSIIISSQIAIGDDGSTYAARLCNEQRISEGAKSYADWYLPSWIELTIMYDNRATINATALANSGTAFVNTWYWSSTEYNTTTARAVNLVLGLVNDEAKTQTHKVRAIRAF